MSDEEYEASPEPEDVDEDVGDLEEHYEVSEEQMEETRRQMASRRELLDVEDEEVMDYWDTRMTQREKEDEEIAQLRAKIEQRRVEREADDQRMKEKQKAEENARKEEEAARKTKKEAEEAERREKREAERMAAEAGKAMAGKRNFTITKRDGTVVEPTETDGEEGPKQKSKEQLEAEKQAALSQRIVPLDVDGLSDADLEAKAKELQAKWTKIEGDKYDLEQEYKRKQYDLMELAERARQVNKGGKKGGGGDGEDPKGRQRGMSIIQIDNSADRMNDKHINAPPKIQLCSKYERHTDHRSYTDRMDYFQSGGDKKKGGGAIDEEAGEGEEEE